MKTKWIVAMLVLAVGASFVGCTTEDNGEYITHSRPIIQGTEAPNNTPYTAVVSLHDNSKRGVSVSPFCSGTLIAEDVVLTAAHCSSGKRASKLAVYFGKSAIEAYDAGTLSYDDFYMVDDVSVHGSYNANTITHDISLLRLKASVPSSVAVPVPALPNAVGQNLWNQGLPLDFAGFGVDQNDYYGLKLHVVGTFDHLQGDHQIYYYQPWDDGGPCSGDSGGPAFVKSGGVDYVGGITSYGDYYCASYGVSTRTDNADHEQYINDYLGVNPPPPPPPDCSADGTCNPDCAQGADPDCGGGGGDPTCGDGTCDAGEDCYTCSTDCPLISHPKKGVQACCGNGNCERREDASTCAIDCL